MSTQLDQIAKKAKSNPKLRFTSLAHLLTPEFLTETWKQKVWDLVLPLDQIRAS